MRTKKGNWYAADFETNNIDNKEAEVWAAGIRRVDVDDFVCFSSFGDFFKHICHSLKDADNIWFHNLKFDGSFIVNEIIKIGYKPTKAAIKDMKVGEFRVLINGLGQWYVITLKVSRSKVLYVKNSLNKIPFKIKKIAEDLNLEVQKGEIDYSTYRKPGSSLKKEDVEYLKKDVDILAIALNELYYKRNYQSLTIGADCLGEFREMTKDFFDILFPNVDDVFEDLNNYYKGGLCIVGKMKSGAGVTLDRNSMYPAEMHSNSGNYYPVGVPEKFSGEYVYDEDKPLFIQHIRANFEIKEDRIPFLQCETESYYTGFNEFLTTSNGEMYDLYLSCIDLDMLFNNYDVYELEYVDGYKFEQRIGMFDEYINKWYSVKENAKQGSVEGMLAKLFLNNLGGKFGTSVKSTSYQIDKIDDEGILKLRQEESVRKGVYIPVAIFMTSYARRTLIKAINDNYKYFNYCDTDSVHLSCSVKEVQGLDIDDKKLGYWKIENVFDSAIYLKQKAYAEKVKGVWNYTVSGMDEELKKAIRIEDFKIGFTTEGTDYKGTLRSQRVKGGTILKPVPFTIL